MYCDVLFEKIKSVSKVNGNIIDGIDIHKNGIECIIDNEQVLLKKENDVFKYHSLNKSKTSYLNGTKSAKFKHVDNLIEDKKRVIKYNPTFEEAYNNIRTTYFKK